jgi:RNA polymerase sigma factor, sigma-70 family
MPQSEDRITPTGVIQQTQLDGLIKRAKARDFLAFELLYHAYKKVIWERLAFLLGDKETAHDIFQETFLRVWINLPELKQEVPFEAWIRRIAVNLAIDYLRHEKKVVFVSLSHEGLEQRSWDVGIYMDSPEIRLSEQDYIEQTLARLPLRYRTCLLLQDHWGYSQREIAQILNISEKGVSAYVSRSRKLFREIYSRLLQDSDGTKENK